MREVENRMIVYDVTMREHVKVKGKWTESRVLWNPRKTFFSGTMKTNLVFLQRGDYGTAERGWEILYLSSHLTKKHRFESFFGGWDQLNCFNRNLLVR